MFLQRGEEEDDPPGIQPRRRPPAEPPGLAPGRAGQRRVHDQPRAAGRVAEVAGRYVHEQLRPLSTATGGAVGVAVGRLPVALPRQRPHHLGCPRGRGGCPWGRGGRTRRRASVAGEG